MRLDKLHNKPKDYIKGKVTFLLSLDIRFNTWFEDKFMKYGGKSDWKDIDTLRESIDKLMEEHINK